MELVGIPSAVRACLSIGLTTSIRTPSNPQVRGSRGRSTEPFAGMWARTRTTLSTAPTRLYVRLCDVSLVPVHASTDPRVSRSCQRSSHLSVVCSGHNCAIETRMAFRVKTDYAARPRRRLSGTGVKNCADPYEIDSPSASRRSWGYSPSVHRIPSPPDTGRSFTSVISSQEDDWSNVDDAAGCCRVPERR